MVKSKKESVTLFTTKILVVVLMTLLAWFFLGEVYDINLISRTLIALVAGISFFYQWKKMANIYNEI